MTLPQAKTALHGYLDRVSVLRQMHALHMDIPESWIADAESQVRAMCNVIDEMRQCRFAGRRKQWAMKK